MSRAVALCSFAAVLLSGRALSEDGEAITKRSGAGVVSVADGDTIKVRRGEGTEDVRLLAIDAPESSAVRYVAVDCGGQEATASLERLFDPGDQVRLIADPSQDRRDRCGRLLAYVEHRGVDVGRKQLLRGLAETYVFDPSSPPRRTAAYRRDQGRAEASGVGVYALCGGEFHTAEG